MLEIMEQMLNRNVIKSLCNGLNETNRKMELKGSDFSWLLSIFIYVCVSPCSVSCVCQCFYRCACCVWVWFVCFLINFIMPSRHDQAAAYIKMCKSVCHVANDWKRTLNNNTINGKWLSCVAIDYVKVSLF